jgi:hypothetical protein
MVAASKTLNPSRGNGGDGRRKRTMSKGRLNLDRRGRKEEEGFHGRVGLVFSCEVVSICWA